MQAALEVEPAGDVCPEEQEEQKPEPAEEYLLAAHCTHDEAVVPAFKLKEPAGQEKGEGAATHSAR